MGFRGSMSLKTVHICGMHVCEGACSEEGPLLLSVYKMIMTLPRTTPNYLQFPR